MNNLNTLEKLARRIVNGGDVTERSNYLLKLGRISPAEHQAINSYSWRGGFALNGTSAAGIYASDQPMRIWF